MRQKIDLTELRVSSFVTSVNDQKQAVILGGQVPDSCHCGSDWDCLGTWYHCGSNSFGTTASREQGGCTGECCV